MALRTPEIAGVITGLITCADWVIYMVILSFSVWPSVKHVTFQRLYKVEVVSVDARSYHKDRSAQGYNTVLRVCLREIKNVVV